MFRHALFIALSVVVLCPANSVIANHDDGNLKLFTEEILPLLKANCLKCHSGEKPKGGLSLTSRQGLLEGGESGPAVDLQNHADSVLLQAINFDGYEMPPTGKMSPKQIAAFMQWVTGGLAWPEDLHEIEVEQEPDAPEVNEKSKQFWSFQPVRKPAVPEVKSTSFVQNDIDRFIAEKLQTAGLSPSPPAEPTELVRRIHYDLLGLPPEPTFVQQWSERISGGKGRLKQDAVSELIDQLLKSPHYGEKWGRHWLDLVRYAETNSYERDGAKPFVWRYRDYVINAFNQDKPYDRFILEQLAGDELSDSTPDSMIATGYYRLGRWDDEPADPKLALYDELDDIVTTTGQTFLGLTVNCARCHDHKIDPVPQRDYYRLLSFFQNIQRYGVRSEDSVRQASVAEIDKAADPDQVTEATQKYENEIKDARKQLKQIEDLIWDSLENVEKEEFQYEMNRVPIVEKREGSLLTDRQVNRYRKQTERLRDLRANKPSGLASALVVKENVKQIGPTYVLTRGNPHVEGEVVTPGFPAVLSPPEVVMPQVPESAASSGRRRVLANWIASPENPLTARVMINRIWQYHFGRGIVRTSSDFGFQGSRPTHPELLDWLASEFISSGWSVKQMHRLIMSSAVYQMSSRPNEQSYAKDPTNDLFWRFDMRRLTAEEIRDSILWVNGSLNADKMYGPSIFTDIPDAVKAGQSRPGAGWGQSSPEDKVRRSIYIHVKRSLLDPILESFDYADTDQSCPVRFVTTQPTQALGLLNSDFSLQQAQIFAGYLKQHSETETDRVKLALTRVTQRNPTDDEIARGINLMNDLRTVHQMDADESLTYFCLVALNLNEFLYLD